MGKPETVPLLAQFMLGRSESFLLAEQALDSVREHLPEPLELRGFEPVEFPEFSAESLGFPELAVPQFQALSLREYLLEQFAPDLEPFAPVANAEIPEINITDFGFDLG
ncbi:MAG: hypothetical protein R3316_12095 [Rhodovibrionaceae bacterium]|nr:hypothetical protein [Rhodovibrionaceae bacterium]